MLGKANTGFTGKVIAFFDHDHGLIPVVLATYIQLDFNHRGGRSENPHMANCQRPILLFGNEDLLD